MMERKKVKDYMTYDVVTVDAHGTVRDVIEAIKRPAMTASRLSKTQMRW